jgi:bacillithiol system protein YtxJ
MEFIQTSSHLESAVQSSYRTPALFFKHSTQCPISAAAHKEVERLAQTSEFPIFLIRVIEERPLSNQLAELVGVRHASPQAMILVNGQSVWVSSHWDITEAAIRQAFGAI